MYNNKIIIVIVSNYNNCAIVFELYFSVYPQDIPDKTLPFHPTSFVTGLRKPGFHAQL